MRTCHRLAEKGPRIRTRLQFYAIGTETKQLQSSKKRSKILKNPTSAWNVTFSWKNTSLNNLFQHSNIGFPAVGKKKSTKFSPSGFRPERIGWNLATNQVAMVKKSKKHTKPTKSMAILKKKSQTRFWWMVSNPYQKKRCKYAAFFHKERNNRNGSWCWTDTFVKPLEDYTSKKGQQVRWSQGRSTPCIGDGHPTFSRESLQWVYEPLLLGWWVYPLLYGNNGSWSTLAQMKSENRSSLKILLGLGIVSGN